MKGKSPAILGHCVLGRPQQATPTQTHPRGPLGSGEASAKPRTTSGKKVPMGDGGSLELERDLDAGFNIPKSEGRGTLLGQVQVLGRTLTGMPAKVPCTREVSPAPRK